MGSTRVAGDGVGSSGGVGVGGGGQNRREVRVPLPPPPALPPLHERPRDVHLLAQDLLPVHLSDGRLGVAALLVLDQRVALNEPAPPVQVQVQVLQLAELGKRLVKVLLLRLYKSKL
jgi:hypothetical protein